MLISGTLWFLIAFFAYTAYVYGQGLYFPVIAFSCCFDRLRILSLCFSPAQKYDEKTSLARTSQGCFLHY